jgi:SRSO17 transposase
VRTAKPKAAAAARIGAALARRKRAELLEGLRPCFARTEPWLQAGKYAAAVMSQIPRRNGWTIAAHIGDRAPDRTQRLLSRAVWDTVAAMAVVRRFAVAGLDEAAAKTGRRRGLAVGAVDETGQVKAGARTAGVKRQYLGCVGKVANGINTVHLAYVREGAGHALTGAREWIPAEHLKDPVKSVVMGLPADLVFRTKGQLAIDILAEALADGVRLDFVCGDEVYGSCTELREFCEARDQAYVLRVPSSFRLTLASGVTLTCKQAAARLGRRRGWEVRSAGSGSKGQRWYAWAWLGTASPRHHLLIRRHLTTGDLAFCYCYLPDGQPVAPSRPIRAAGLRWPAEEDFEFGKDCFGLHRYGWQRLLDRYGHRPLSRQPGQAYRFYLQTRGWLPTAWPHYRWQKLHGQSDRGLRLQQRISLRDARRGFQMVRARRAQKALLQAGPGHKGARCQYELCGVLSRWRGAARRPAQL